MILLRQPFHNPAQHRLDHLGHAEHAQIVRVYTVIRTRHAVVVAEKPLAVDEVHVFVARGARMFIRRAYNFAALGAFGGTLGYGYILNAPKNTILPASFIGLAGYIVYILLGMAGFGTMSAYFFSTVFVSVVCELLARKMRTPATIFLLSALVPLVPGYNFYLAMLALVENRGAAAAREGVVAVQIVAAIAVGAAVTSVLFRALAEKNRKPL